VFSPDHFVYVKLNDGCPVPPTCKEWKTHRVQELETWKDKSLVRQSVFEEPVNIEIGEHETNDDDPVILSDDEVAIDL
jgi:hypothetical protein